MATVEDSSWRDNIYTQLQQRNRTQTYFFQDLITAHNKLFENTDALRNENLQLSLQNERLRLETVNTAGSTAGGTSSTGSDSRLTERIQHLEQKLLTQQEELTELHRRKGENSQQIIDLNIKLQEKEKFLASKEVSLADSMAVTTSLRAEIRMYENSIKELQNLNQTIRDEHQALQLAFASLEDKLRKVQEENRQLLERLIHYKTKDAEKMNEENDNFLKKKHAKVQKELEEACKDMKGLTLDDFHEGSGPMFQSSLPTAVSVKFDAHEGEVNAVKWGPDPHIMATGGADRKVQLWDISKGTYKNRGVLVGSNAAVMSVDFDSTGTLILGASNDFASRVWSVADQRLRAKRRNARATAEQKDALLNFMELNKALAQNKITGPERNRLWAKLTARLNCLGGSNKNEQQWMKFWNDLKGYTRAKARDALKVRNRTGEAGPSGLNTPPPVLNATDEKIMALIGIDMADGDGVTRELGMGHTATLKRKRSPTRPSSSSPANFYVSNDNSFQEEVDTGSISGISSDMNTHTLTGHSGKVMAGKFLGEQSKVVTGSYDRTLKIWDLRSRACVETKFAGSSCNDLVTVDGAGSTIISGHYDKRIRFWDTRSESNANDILLQGKVTSLDLSRDSNYLISCVRDDTLKLIDLRMNQIILSFSCDGFKVGCDWTRATFSPDGQYVAVGSADGSVFIWGVNTAKVETVLKDHGSAVTSTSWNPFGNYLASVDRAKKAIVWGDG